MRASVLLFLLVACQKPPAQLPLETPPTPSHTWAFTTEPHPNLPQKIAASVPLSLTASDGTGLAIARMAARAVVEAPLAFTEIHLVFDNPRDQQIEGQFRITLPERASVSRFAMKLGNDWQEGEVVERQAARRAYEDFLHRRQDPALLEQQAGNEFAARIFPIPARGQKEIIISYSEELLTAPYRLSLLGLPQLAQLDISVNGTERHEKRFTPTEDFVLAGTAQTGVALRNDNLLVARITPFAEVAPDPIESLLILVDTSASRTLGRESDLALLKDLLGRLKDAPVAVWAFDQTSQLIGEGPASKVSLETLAKRRPLGASNLEQAIASVKGSFARALLITDGVVTAGAEKLSIPVRRVDAIAVGGIRDQSALARIAKNGLVIDGALPSELIAKKLNHEVKNGIKVAVPGADWVWPETLDGVQPGDQAIIYADLAAGKPVSIALDDKPLPAGAMKSAARPMLERAWVAARIKKLLDQKERSSDQDLKNALTKTALELSTTHRVLCPLTALLVLETEGDYQRFKIDRKALADILVVEGNSVALKSRKMPVLTTNKLQLQVADKDAPVTRAPPPPSPSDMREQKGSGLSGAVSGLGLRGTGAGGGGSGEGIGSLGAAAAPKADSAVLDSLAGDDARKEASMAERSARVRDEEQAEPEAPRQMVVAAPPPVEQPQINPYTGVFQRVMSAIRKKDATTAMAQAETWWQQSPGDVMALVALGEALEASNDPAEAARAYGSLIDLFPARADMRRFAGQRLERLKLDSALALATDTYKQSVAQRPDHPQSHRLFAYALLKQGRAEEAFAALEKALQQHYPNGRFAAVEQILAEDLGLAAAVWTKSAPERADEIAQRLQKAGGRKESGPSLRFVLSWETDANDVDFHIYDGKGGHAFYSQMALPSGGELYADVTTGYGPECFTIRGKGRTYPYKLQAHYYSRGPMGYGMGKLSVVQHDGRGTLSFDDRPFVVMQDQAFLDLGTVSRAL